MNERIVPIVESRLNKKVNETVHLRGGMNNQLYRLRMEDHQDLLAKIYYQDDRRRLDR